MPGEFLPPVITRLEGDISDLAAKVETAKGIIKSLGDVTVPVNFDLNQASLARAEAAAKAAAKSFGDVKSNLDFGIDDASLLAAIAAMKGLEGATDNATSSGGRFYRRWWMNGTLLHWLATLTMEYLAVAIPGTIALGAALAIQSEGWLDLAGHIEGVYIATSATNAMFGETAGKAIGLKGTFQQVAEAMKPNTWQIFGSAINTVNEGMGTMATVGVAVTRIMDTFAAKVDYDFSAAGGIGGASAGLGAKMIPDLVEFGQILGNLGHGFLNLAGDMPGVAEILLKLLDYVAQGVLWFSQLNHYVLEFAFGAHEVYMWGHLLWQIFEKIAGSKLGGFFASTAQGLANLVTGATNGTKGFAGFTAKALEAASTSKALATEGVVGIDALTGLAVAADGTTVAVEALTGAERANAIAGALMDAIDPWMWAVAGTVALGALVFWLSRTKTSTEQLVTSVQKTVAAASDLNVVNTIAAGMEKVNAAMSKTPEYMQESSVALAKNGGSIRELTPAYSQLQSEQEQLGQQFVNVGEGAAYLAQTYHITIPQAMALAQQAGVSLTKNITGQSEASTILRDKIAGLVQGYRSMSQPIGAVGNDILAVNIQSGLAATQVSKLNSAWDEFMSNLTGGTDNLSNFVQGITNMGTGIANATNNLSTGAGTINLTTSQFAQALTSFSGNGAQAWQNFDQVVGSTAPQLIDWLREAGAEGALSGPKFSQSVLDMAASLVPFAKNSKTAQTEVLGLVQQAGLNISTWPQLESAIKNTGASAKGLAGNVETATNNMGNMAKVASSLGTAVQNDLITDMAQAKLKVDGVSGAMVKYLQSIQNGDGATKAGQSTRAKLISDLEKAGLNAKQAAAYVKLLGGNVAALHSKAITVTENIKDVFSTSGPATAALGILPGHAAGTSGAEKGWAWVGEKGPELAYFHGGETVLPAGTSKGYAGGTPPSGAAEIHNHIYLDGQEIAAHTRTATYTYNADNGNRARGGGPSGAMTPRGN